MDKQVVEMFEIIMKKMNDMDNKITGIQSDVMKMNTRFDTVEGKIDLLDVHLNGGFKQAGERFDKVDEKLNGVGEHFEELSENTVRLRGDVSRELKYITHRINEIDNAIDREVFMRTNPLQ